jgi:hypothetical protein
MNRSHMHSRPFVTPSAVASGAAVAGEVTQPVDPEPPSIPAEPVVDPPSEPVGPVVPDEPAIPIDPSPDREFPEPAGPDVEPEPDPPVRGVRLAWSAADRG